MGLLRLFGAGKVLDLSKQLIALRISHNGMADIFSPELSRMTDFQVLGSADSTIVAVIDLALKNMRKGNDVFSSIAKVEEYRKKSGSNFPSFLQETTSYIKKNHDKTNPITDKDILLMYVSYRVELEHLGRMKPDDIARAFEFAYASIIEW